MLEGRITLSSDLAQIVREDGVVLADGALIVDSDRQAFALEDGRITSAVQFVGTLTPVGVEALS